MDEQRQAILTEFKNLRNTGYDSWIKAHNLYNQAFMLWKEGGYSGLRSTPNSRFFQEVMDEFGRFPQMFSERNK